MEQPNKITVVPGKYAWCVCRLSKNFPYCDGSHQPTNKVPEIEIIEKDTDKYICTCGKSSNTPFCDGAHNKESQNTPE